MTPCGPSAAMPGAPLLAVAGVHGAADPTEPLALDIRHALLTLPVRQRAAIALYYLDDLPVADIAGLLDCSEGTVKTHLARPSRALPAARRGGDR